MSIFESLLIVVLASAFGGIAYGITHRTSRVFRAPGGSEVDLGALGDAMIGVAAGVGVFFVAGALFGIELSANPTAELYLRTLALGILAGFAGAQLLTGLSDHVMQQVQSIDSKVEVLRQEMRFHDQLMKAFYLLDIEPANSLSVFETVLALEQDNEKALVGLGAALKRLGRINEAIEAMDRLLALNPTSEVGHYNRACYKSVRGDDEESVLIDLEKAIDLLPDYRDYARREPDLESIRSGTGFNRVMSGPTLLARQKGH